MTGQHETLATRKLWIEYRTKAGKIIRRVAHSEQPTRLSPRAIATIRARRDCPARVSAYVFGISEVMVYSIRSGRRLARHGLRSKPVSAEAFLRMVMAQAVHDVRAFVEGRERRWPGRRL